MIGISSPVRSIYTLGPEGTYSEKAARRLQELLRKKGPGEPPQVIYTRTLPEVLARTEADVESLGVLPLENSDTGTVAQAQDALGQHKVRILLEISLKVIFDLLANGPLENVKALYTQPVALDQCGRYLSKNLPGAETVLTHSNSESGELYLRGRGKGVVAAIVLPEFAERHPAERVARGIQNYQHNTTRFVVVGAVSMAGEPDLSRAKSTLLVDPMEDRPGLLYDILSVFKRHGLNLTRLESRPASGRAWTYVFYLDIINNPSIGEALEEFRREGIRVNLLGSYDSLE
ncbi:MAG: ACT domain-containing protein [Deltaproteobacteria bacterium]|nr:ACT domain-containing protein [Deltaproteobacteria bacterium]